MPRYNAKIISKEREGESGVKRVGWIMLVLAWMVGMRADACTRVLYVDAKGRFVMTGRNMDWYLRYPASMWKFPRGMRRGGLSRENPLQWVSRYGSVVLVQTAQSQNAVVDGMNEKGLVANLLYLKETDYGKRDPARKGLATSVLLQYLLDSFATVAGAVSALEKGEIQVVPVPIPGSEHLPTMHFSLSDASGDSAVIEILHGKMLIHHSRDYRVMTNSPVFEKQLALNAYWREVGGESFLPGTRRSSDRYARADFYIRNLPEPEDGRQAVFGVLSVLRNVSSPFGASDPEKPNLSTTIWRTVARQKNPVYFYESTESFNTVWVEFEKFDFSEGTPVKSVRLEEGSEHVGEISGLFVRKKAPAFARP